MATHEGSSSIDIWGNRGLCAGGFDGIVNCWEADGSAELPYVISGWTFRPMDRHALGLWWTTKHIIIRDNVFEHATLPPNTGRGGTGIVLNDAENVRIEDNTFRHLWYGVDGFGARVEVARNFFEDNSNAIDFDGSSVWTIHHNYLADSDIAIQTDGVGGRIDLNQFRFNDIDVDIPFATGQIDLRIRRNNFESTDGNIGEFPDDRHVRAAAHPIVDAECNWWTVRQANGITIEDRPRVSDETDTSPQLQEREPNAGPAGKDPPTRVPPTGGSLAQRLPDWLACYDVVTGGPV